MKNTFHLVITAYNEIIYSGDAVLCVVTTSGGSLGLEAGHEPLLSILKENSDVAYEDPAGERKSVSVRSGFLSVKQNKCTITVNT